MTWITITTILDKVQLSISECGEVCSSFLNIDEAHDLGASMAAGHAWSIDDGDDRLVNWSPFDRLLLVGGGAYKVPAELVHRVAWSLSNDVDFSTVET